MPWSRSSPRVSRNEASVATRGVTARPITDCMMCGARGPDTRTMPRPPRPAGVATATMVSPARFMRSCAAGECALAALRCGRRGFAPQQAVHVPLLEDLDAVVDEPVQHETRREE